MLSMRSLRAAPTRLHTPLPRPVRTSQGRGFLFPRSLGTNNMDSLLGSDAEEQINKIVASSSNELVVLDFMATWCRKCIVLKPKISKLQAEEYPAIPFVYINVNEAPYSLMQQYKIEKLPTIVVVRDGKEAARMLGGEDVGKVIESLRGLIQEVKTAGSTMGSMGPE